MNQIVSYNPINQFPPVPLLPHNVSPHISDQTPLFSPQPLPPNVQPHPICLQPAVPSVPMDTHVGSHKISQRLLYLTSATGYDLIQQNGQRRFGPPPNWNRPPPLRGSEIFVGKIPRDMYEDELFPIFSAVGLVYEIRLMMNFSGYNRGFAFVTYCNPIDAWRAVKQLNDFEVRPGNRIGVSKSVDNCRLYIGGIPTNKTKEEAWVELTQYLQGITTIIMYADRVDRKLNRGFMFVEFCTHRAAAMAKRKMSPGTVQLWNTTVMVDWADPEPDIDPNVLSNVTKLFIRNISPNINDKYIRSLLLNFVPPQTIERIYIAEDYGFIHFSHRIHAQLALDHINGISIDGYRLEVHWARPRSYIQTTVDSQMRFCRSLPPKFKKTSPNGSSKMSGSESETESQKIILQREDEIDDSA